MKKTRSYGVWTDLDGHRHIEPLAARRLYSGHARMTMLHVDGREKTEAYDGVRAHARIIRYDAHMRGVHAATSIHTHSTQTPAGPLP